MYIRLQGIHDTVYCSSCVRSSRDKTSTSGTMLRVRLIIFFILFFFLVLALRFAVVTGEVAGVCSYSFPSFFWDLRFIRVVCEFMFDLLV